MKASKNKRFAWKPSWIAGVLAACALSAVAAKAEANCRALEVLDTQSICRGVNGCPPGEFLYSVTLRNKSNRRLYVAYRFLDPRGILTRGGLDIAPDSDIERPIGFGRTAITKEEPDVTRRGRFRAASCGHNEKTKFNWRK